MGKHRRSPFAPGGRSRAALPLACAALVVVALRTVALRESAYGGASSAARAFQPQGAAQARGPAPEAPALFAPPPPHDFCITQADVAAAPRHRIFVASTVNDALPYLPEYLQSLADQQWPHLTAVVYDDGSADGGADYLEAAAPQMPFPMVVIRGPGRKGPAFAKWELVKYIRGAAEPMDLVLFLDGDDKLFRPDVLAEVDAAFRTQKPWFAYGRQRGYFEEECRAPPHIWSSRTTSSVRKFTWRYCHPRVMRAFLLNHLKVTDFRVPDGRWLQKYTDRQLVYKPLELAGDSRVAFMASRPHVYYRIHKRMTMFEVSKSEKLYDFKYTKSLPPEPRLSAPVHIVMCASGGVDQLQLSLTSIVDAQNMDGRQVFMHVCALGASAAAVQEHEAVLRSLRSLAGWHLRAFTDGSDGFARFSMMADAARSYPVDHFVMVDEDVVLPAPGGLMEVVRAARPRELVAWWGRHFTAFQGFGDSRLSYDALLRGGEPGLTKFHHASTRLAVVDADIVRFHQDLLDKAPPRFHAAHDLWLSYVVHQAGWDARRLVLPGVRLRGDPLGNGTLNALEAGLPEKERLLGELRECGWNV